MGIRQILRAAWFTPGPRGVWGLPMLFEGKPGTAKTATIEAEAGAAGLHAEVLISSLRAPEDFGGIPFPEKDHKGLIRLPDAWVRRVIAKERCVVFFDELNLCPPAVLAALLRVINERVVGDHALPPTVRMVAAQNSVEDGGGGDLTAAMANRFGHYKWEGYTREEWAEWILSGGSESTGEALSAMAEEARVLDAWGGPFALARGQVTGFLKTRPNFYHAQPKANDPKASKAFPTPRTWELATRALAGAKIHALTSDDADDLVTAFVGVEAAAEFATWRQKADLPDPEALLDGKVKFTHSAARLDRTEAVLSACAAFVAPTTTQKRIERANALWGLIETLTADARDLAVPATRTLIDAKLGSTQCAAAKPVMVKMYNIIQGAGLIKGST